MRGESLAKALRDGVFVELLYMAINSSEFISEFDRLKGHNLSRRGTPLDLAIDDACDRTDQALDDFTDFIWDLASRIIQ